MRKNIYYLLNVRNNSSNEYKSNIKHPNRSQSMSKIIELFPKKK